MEQHGRLEWWEPGDLDDERRAVYDSIAGGRRASGPQHFALTDARGRLQGPFNAMLLSPRIGAALQALGAELRYGSSLTDRQRELAILQVAEHHRSEFEWYAHAAIGRAVGLTDEELATLAGGQIAVTFDATERMVATVVRALLDVGDLHDEVLVAATDHLETATIFEIVALVGYYELLARSLRVWRTPLPEGVAPQFDANETAPALVRASDATAGEGAVPSGPQQ